MGANTKTDSLLDHRCNGLARKTPVSYSGARRDSGAVPGSAKISGAVELLPFVGLASALWLAPRWYAKPRQPLTAIVVASLTLGATATWVFAA